jgi:hypothetical protein
MSSKYDNADRLNHQEIAYNTVTSLYSDQTELLKSVAYFRTYIIPGAPAFREINISTPRLLKTPTCIAQDTLLVAP